MTIDRKPTCQRGGNPAFPTWDRVPDSERDPEDQDCSECDGNGEVFVRDGYVTCRECRGTGVER